MTVTELGMNESIRCMNTSFLGHFYYQRANFREKLSYPLQVIKEDYSMSYSLFLALDLDRYVDIVKKGREEYLLFKF